MKHPLDQDDTTAILRAFSTCRVEGSQPSAVEVNPARRLEAGAFKLCGVDLVSNGLVPFDRFDVKVTGRVFEFDTMSFRYDAPTQPY